MNDPKVSQVASGTAETNPPVNEIWRRDSASRPGLASCGTWTVWTLTDLKLQPRLLKANRMPTPEPIPLFSLPICSGMEAVELPPTHVGVCHYECWRKLHRCWACWPEQMLYVCQLKDHEACAHLTRANGMRSPSEYYVGYLCRHSELFLKSMKLVHTSCSTKTSLSAGFRSSKIFIGPILEAGP